MDSALFRLWDREHRLIRLLDPPYPPDRESSPGYITGYGEGFRENGGQYTHGAIWLAIAALRLGRSAEGTAMLETLPPETHEERIYQATLCTPGGYQHGEGARGACGLDMVHGPAGWYFRAVTRELLGLRMRERETLYRIPRAAGIFRMLDRRRRAHSHDRAQPRRDHRGR